MSFFLFLVNNTNADGLLRANPEWQNSWSACREEENLRNITGKTASDKCISCSLKNTKKACLLTPTFFKRGRNKGRQTHWWWTIIKYYIELLWQEPVKGIPHFFFFFCEWNYVMSKSWQVAAASLKATHLMPPLMWLESTDFSPSVPGYSRTLASSYRWK